MLLFTPTGVWAQTPAPAPQTPPAAAPEPATAPAGPSIPVELNKLETITPGNTGCRVYFVATNPESHAIDQLRLDLILFGADGVIDRRIAFDLAPLPPHKTTVRLFDLPGTPCDGIGRMLINDVIACHTVGEPVGDQNGACLDRLQVSSRAKVPLAK